MHQLDTVELTGCVNYSVSGLKTSTTNDTVSRNERCEHHRYRLFINGYHISTTRAVIHSQDTDEDVIANSQRQRSNSITPGLKGNFILYAFTLETHLFEFLNLLICNLHHHVVVGDPSTSTTVDVLPLPSSSRSTSPFLPSVKQRSDLHRVFP